MLSNSSVFLSPGCLYGQRFRKSRGLEEDGSGSQGCESRVRQSLCRRKVRLERPGPGHRDRVAAIVRIWNEAQSRGRIGRCTVSSSFLLHVLQILAPWVTLSGCDKALGKTEGNSFDKVGRKGVGQKVFVNWYDSDGSGLPVQFVSGNQSVEQSFRRSLYGREVSNGQSHRKWRKMVLEWQSHGSLFTSGYSLKGVTAKYRRREGRDTNRVVWRVGNRHDQIPMEFQVLQWVRGQRLMTITCRTSGGVRREKVRENTWLMTRQWNAIRLIGGELVTARGVLFYGIGPNGESGYSGPTKVMVGRLRKLFLDDGLIINYRWSGKQANDEEITIAQWDGIPPMQARVQRLVKRSGAHKNRKENLRRKREIMSNIRGFAWINSKALRNKERLVLSAIVACEGSTKGVFYTVRSALILIVWFRLNLGYHGRGIRGKNFILGKLGSLEETLGKDTKEQRLGVMAEGVAQLLENLSFSEEELLEIGDSEGELSGQITGSEKWLVGKLISPEMVDTEGFDGPFQFEDWLKVELGQQKVQKKKLGIVYKNPRVANEIEEAGEGSSAERLTDAGKGLFQRDKGRTGGISGQRARIVKRTLQGKNEVCNPIAAKRNRVTVSYQGCEDDEVSEATSPVKINPTVEAASQPCREQ
ncbi:hypothetical protein V6N13_008700 [Hibiscus sabdariffa]|uniref:Uncharacterized protein n=1 Tax=Hibiscus sabdariffa TaxID=183260 RepID=A0ABR2ECR5_9ROSI